MAKRLIACFIIWFPKRKYVFLVIRIIKNDEIWTGKKKNVYLSIDEIEIVLRKYVQFRKNVFVFFPIFFDFIHCSDSVAFNNRCWKQQQKITQFTPIKGKKETFNAWYNRCFDSVLCLLQFHPLGFDFFPLSTLFKWYLSLYKIMPFQVD